MNMMVNRLMRRLNRTQPSTGDHSVATATPASGHIKELTDTRGDLGATRPNVRPTVTVPNHAVTSRKWSTRAVMMGVVVVILIALACGIYQQRARSAALAAQKPSLPDLAQR